MLLYNWQYSLARTVVHDTQEYLAFGGSFDATENPHTIDAVATVVFPFAKLAFINFDDDVRTTNPGIVFANVALNEFAAKSTKLE